MYVVGYFHGDRLFVFCSHITVKEGKVLDIGTGPKQHGITNVSRFFFLSSYVYIELISKQIDRIFLHVFP